MDVNLTKATPSNISRSLTKKPQKQPGGGGGAAKTFKIGKKQKPDVNYSRGGGNLKIEPNPTKKPEGTKNLRFKDRTIR